MNGDGLPDVIVGAYNYMEQTPYLALAGKNKSEKGYVQVFSGKDASVLHIFDASSAQYGFGLAVADAGDVDGDGQSDILIGSPYVSAASVVGGGKPEPGFAYVYSGKSGELLATLKDELAGRAFGWSVAGLGDLDSDGHDDVGVGCNQLHPANGSFAVYSGRDWSVLFRFEGQVREESFGEALASAGDVDGDGVADILIGGRLADVPEQNAGVAKVYSGKDVRLLHAWYGEAEFTSFGSSVDGIGDIDGDGHGDLLVGASGLARAGSNAGGFYLFSGRDGHPIACIDGRGAGSELGSHCCGLGDLDGDGVPDFSVAGRRGARGWIGIYSGQTKELMAETPGLSAACAGDVDGDGVKDLIVGSWTVAMQCDTGDSAGIVRVLSVLRMSREKGQDE